MTGTADPLRIGHWLDSELQEAQHAREREARKREDRRNLLDQLQFPLAAARDSSHTAAMLLAAD